MGFLRNARPHLSMFKRRDAASAPEESDKCIDGTDRTIIVSLDEKQDALDELDECTRAPRRRDAETVEDLLRRRLSHHEQYRRRLFRGSQHQVSFIDEELGLTPRHVVTEIHQRPRTADDDRDELYYTARDFYIFEKQKLYESIEDQIRSMGLADSFLESVSRKEQES